jgi:hypothetical protein
MKHAMIVLTLALALCAGAVPVFALDALEADFGLTGLINTDPDSGSSPLMPTLGINLPFGTPLDLEVGVLAWGTYYLYQDGRALPAEVEFRDFWVLGLVADARIGHTFRLGKSAFLGARGGVALLLRVPIPLSAVSPKAQENLGAAFGYLYGKTRFLYPEAEIFGGFPLPRANPDAEPITLRLSLRGYLPLFHLWDGEALPFGDQLMLSGLVGLVFSLPGRNQTKS